MVSVLIVNWNTCHFLRCCLASLQTAFNGPEHEVIVVDNNSGDGSAAMVQQEFPEVKLIANSSNAGFAAGNNQAFRAAAGEVVWLLNPDTEVLPGTPETLLAALQASPRRGAVTGPLLDYETGRPQLSCRTFPRPAALWVEALGLARAFPRSRRFGFYRMSWWDYASSRPVEQPMASSLMLRREAVEKAGGLFDERFPIFFNDVDLSLRLHQAGYETWFEAGAPVHHHGGGSTRQVKRKMIAESHRALRLFYRKHYARRLNPLVYGATMLLVTLSGGLRRLLAHA